MGGQDEVGQCGAHEPVSRAVQPNPVRRNSHAHWRIGRDLRVMPAPLVPAVFIILSVLAVYLAAPLLSLLNPYTWEDLKP